MATSKPSPAVARTLTSLNHLLQSKEFYPAHQKIRTTAARLLKPSPHTATTGSGELEYDEKAKEAVGLLFEGASRMLQVRNEAEREGGEGAKDEGARGSGADLGEYMLEVWEARGVVCGEQERVKVKQLIVLLGPSGAWRKSFIDHVFAWCSKTGPSAAGDPDLHAFVGEIYHKELAPQLAFPHLLLSPHRHSAIQAAEMLYNWSKLDTLDNGLESPEVRAAGRYAARGVIGYLMLSNIFSARLFMIHYLSQLLSEHSNVLVQRQPLSFTGFEDTELMEGHEGKEKEEGEIVITKIASLNFLQLAIWSCQVGVGTPKQGAPPTAKAGTGRAAWQAMVGRYDRDIRWMRLPETRDAISNLSSLYFNIQPQRQGGGNILGDLMSSLFAPGGGAGSGSAPTSRGAAPRGRIGQAGARGRGNGVVSPGLD